MSITTLQIEAINARAANYRRQNYEPIESYHQACADLDVPFTRFYETVNARPDCHWYQDAAIPIRRACELPAFDNER